MNKCKGHSASVKETTFTDRVKCILSISHYLCTNKNRQRSSLIALPLQTTRSPHTLTFAEAPYGCGRY